MKHNPERRAFRGRSHRKWGAVRVRDLRVKSADAADHRPR